MATTAAQTILTFRRGQVRVDLHGRVVYADGQLAKLGGRAFDLLEALIERSERLVPKQELMDVVWPGLVVEENNLQVHVMSLRKLLGSDAIITVSGRGYRFALVPDSEVRSRDASEMPVESSIDSHRLPAPSTLLIGREALIDSICALVRRKDARLVTLTGPGGSGKTRVALHVTGELAQDFAHGSYIVMLAPVRDSAYVASAIAAVLNLQEAGKRSPEELVIGYLRDREVLLTLDNFEHLLVATPLITKLLDTCARLKLLMTSRAVLKLSAEHDVVVPPLALPDAQSTANRARGSPAVRLFVERARTAGYNVESSENDITVTAQICRRLDGLPLAIELAAARLRVLSPQALLARLEHRLQLLKSGPSDLPERQRTLRNAIGWSYELLEPSQQAVFRRLSVFVGGWTLDAAEAVAGGDNLTDPVLDVVDALVDQNLVQRIEDMNGEPRFAMLETVREFADETLERSGQRLAMQKLHAEYFTTFAEKVEPLLTSAKRKPWLAQLQSEVNNFRAALTWLIARSDTANALRLAGALAWMWYFAGQFSEGRNWLRLALELKDADKHIPAKAKVLSGAARLAMYAGDPGAAIRLAEEGVAVWRQTTDPRGLAFALFHLGLAQTMKFFGKEGDHSLRESLGIFRELDDAWGVALATTYLGITVMFKSDSDNEARRLMLEGRARFGALGDDWGLSTSSHYLGTMALREGDYATARELTEEMLQAARDLNDNYRISRNLYQVAEIAFAEKKYDEAIDQLKGSLTLMREQGRIGDGAQLLRFLARLEHERQNPDRAVRLFAAASLHTSKERTFPPDDPAINESVLNATRQALGERRFEIEWVKGVAMSFDQAVAWVLAS